MLKSQKEIGSERMFSFEKDAIKRATEKLKERGQERGNSFTWTDLMLKKKLPYLMQGLYKTEIILYFL